MAASYRFVVGGRVQGVGFRWSAASQAQRLGLQGWVRNCADGSVEGLASGEAAALEQLRSWLAHGPPGARVANVGWSEAGEAPEEAGFVIRR
jgi:acylphosphatase